MRATVLHLTVDLLGPLHQPCLTRRSPVTAASEGMDVHTLDTTCSDTLLHCLIRRRSG